jgi:hypothetical protein
MDFYKLTKPTSLYLVQSNGTQFIQIRQLSAILNQTVISKFQVQDK